ncbi:S-adenosyl-L-methionine-dependent methyltransferase [Lindgomyces ingoldianus]|uniref:S-adenosyl-L-methionine-dependent methyltransferase n=1 Tax=Lindgomyces ingoldianus TaxID=673940 RepID=A0ACB6QQK8_9PLEO|nr:S-adenosyl-L-methionine-dependent methyltransferase [Lindgomyces ingoldianus]KAF2469170.1 S-adenosyl-L-methionine-dependent methyltransferase [Lindgomyces ingoldianus]
MPKMLPEEANIAIDAAYDKYHDEDDDDRMTYTSGQSLASNVTRYRYENGRRYHAFRDGSYYGPNDEKSMTQETIVHHLWLLTLNDKLFLAPIENPQMILDVGTGTGLWAIDMADYFPSAEIIATDLSPTQDTTAPPNIRFEIDDASSEWTYPESSFDFVHARGLTGCIKDWPYLYQQCYKHLKPGGYFEHLEFSVQTNADPNSDNHADKMYTAFSNSILNLGEEKTGMTFRTIESMRGFMEQAGFVDIVEKKFVWPIGPWPSDPHLKDMGRWGERNWADGLEGWVLALYTRVLGWTYTEVQQFVSEFKAVIKDRKNHYYHEVRCVYGRKPFLGEFPTASAAPVSAGG